LALVDATDKANIVHWSSVKCKRVTRSVLASELYAMAHGFDIGTAVKSTSNPVDAMTKTKASSKRLDPGAVLYIFVGSRCLGTS
jgi:hypothetical protein